MLKPLFALASIGMALGMSPAFAQDAVIHPAEPGSIEDKAGYVILYFVGGRTKEEAMATSNDFNPYQIGGEDLLFSVGSFFITTSYEGQALKEGELAVFPQFNTPFSGFEPSAATPGIIPFALMKNGTCHAGFVTGYPVPDTINAIDLTGQVCHAQTVEELLYADYAARNPEPVVEPEEEPSPAEAPAHVFDPLNPTPLDLDTIVWAAYNGAFSVAMADPDYLFVRDGNQAPLLNAIEAELKKEGFEHINIVDAPLPADAYGCAAPGGVDLRFAITNDNAGLVLVAASSRLASTYVYDPDVSADLDIDFSHECRTEGLGRPGTLGVH